MPKLKAIIFDFDGVIAESVDIKSRGFAYVFRDHPDKVDEIVRFHLEHGGISRFEKFEWIYKNLLHKPLSAEEKKVLGDRFARFVYSEVVKSPYVKGALEVLEKYHGRLLLFIVSGTPEEEIVSIVKDRKIDKYFAGVFGAPRKKDVLNLEILRQYGLKPEEVIFVGDSKDDHEGARKAGIRFIGRAAEKGAFGPLKVDEIISDLTGLEKLIDNKYV